ncbi:MAG: ATP-binding protein [Halofilum sp. (in: g-proteobacteria)]|nr:ATP-binding protein [Halofilum sp. (in: g-proteobacteria)]
MALELWQLFGVAVAYLGLLFLVAWLVERGYVPERLARHPLTITLSLGVYATSWTFYGSVGFAHSAGLSFLTIYLGPTIAFLLAPILLMPILRLVREYQLTSVADLFAFRYPGAMTGLVVTVFMLLGILPYISLQIQAVTQSVEVLTGRSAPNALAFVFCATLTVFAILFGARHLTPREKHSGLVVAIAFESAVKLLALLAVGAFAVWGVFGGLGELRGWSEGHPEATERLFAPVTAGPWVSLILLAFCAAFLLPRQFHMAFTENPNPAGLRAASWLFPLYLLLLNLPIIPILWAGQALGTPTDPDFYVLGITLVEGHGLLPLITFIGGISASSAMMIVTTIALASMTLNHCILPLRFISRRPQTNLYRWVLWGKRILIALVVAAGYGFYRVIVHNQGLVQLGLISFVAVAQLLPGIVGVLFWRRGTAAGFLAGLSGGALIWFGMLIVPLLVNSHILSGDTDLVAFLAPSGADLWSAATFWSLALNAFLFVGVSLLDAPNEAETKAAQACAEQRLMPLAGRVEAASPQDFERQLARLIGRGAARSEVRKALAELDMARDELRPAELRLLRERIHRNLSGLVGPALAQLIVDDRLQLKRRSHIALADGIRFMEDQLADSRNRLRGLTAQLHSLQRYHRDVLHELPLGVCALAPDGEIVIWNFAMKAVSGIEGRDAIGKYPEDLPAPWGAGLAAFVAGEDDHRFKEVFRVGDRERWCNLHKARIDHGAVQGHVEDPQSGGTVVLVEDRTDLETLEAELRHSERLASIGRLAAGVAHEIGNPLTGIASLAQNLHYDDTAESRQQTADAVLEQTQRISAIVESLLAFSHGGRPRPLASDRVALAPAIDEAIRLVGLGRTEKHIDFRNECPAGVAVVGDGQLLQQVFVNLLSNAADASSPGSPVVVRAHGADGGEVVLQVIDSGRGIDPEVVERLFDPFFTTKPLGEGTGLGLPLIHSIITEHGGHISLAPGERCGTVVTIRLPSADAAPQARMESAT